MNCKSLKQSLLLLCIAGCGLLASLKGQNRLSLGGYAGGAWDKFTLAPDDPYIKDGFSWVGNQFGAFLSYRLNWKRTWLEGEFHRQRQFAFFDTYQDNFEISPSTRGWWTGGILLKKQIPLVGERLYLSPRAGFHLGGVDENGFGGSVWYSTNRGQLSYAYDLEPVREGIFNAWLQAGVNLELQFTNGMFLFGRLTLSQGLFKIYDDELIYALGNIPLTTLDFYSRGSSLNGQFGLSYPISRIWEGKQPIE